MIRFDFNDASVVVTGSGSGVGLAIAQAFQAAGARVALGDLNAEAAERAASAPGGKALGRALDVRDAASVRSFFDAAEREMGPVTVAVANAAVFPNCPMVDLPVEEWDRVISGAA